MQKSTGQSQNRCVQVRKYLINSKRAEQGKQSLLGSQFVYIGVLSDDFATVDFREVLCYHSRPKKHKFRGYNEDREYLRRATFALAQFILACRFIVAAIRFMCYNIITGEGMNDMKIRTDRLVIRNFRRKNARELKDIAKDFNLSEYAVYDRPLSENDEDVKVLAERFARSKTAFAVYCAGQMIGYAVFHKVENGYDVGLLVLPRKRLRF